MRNQVNSAALSLVALLSLPAVAHAEDAADSRFSVQFQRDADGKLSPDTFLPLQWSDKWSSGIGYRDTTQFSTEKLAGLPESKLGTSIDDRRIRLNLLSYVDSGDGLKYSLGADLQRIDIAKNEFGYFHLVMTTPAINDWIAFDNTVKIAVTSFALRGDVTLGGDKDSPYMLRIGGIVAPSSSLKVSQETDFKPIVSTTGTSSTSSSQKTNWELTLESRYRLTEWLSVGLDGRYEVLPLRYKMEQLSTTLNSFNQIDVETTDTTTRIGMKFIFKTPEMALHPLIGVARESVNTKDNLAGVSSKTSRTLVLLGLTGQF